MVEPEQQYQRGMVVVAHADDAEWGCSGTVAKWCAAGWEVVYVLCTDGSKGSDDLEITSQDLVETRKQEQINAGKVLGLRDVVFLGHEDAMLQPTLELRRDIVREIRRYQPDVLICMGPSRQLTGNGYIGHPRPFCLRRSGPFGSIPIVSGSAHFPGIAEGGSGAAQG
jgi:LmbE family N-acetylglucosaminyl deacetylase